MDNLKDALRQSRVYWLILIAMAVVLLMPAPSRPLSHVPQAGVPALTARTAQMEKSE